MNKYINQLMQMQDFEITLRENEVMRSVDAKDNKAAIEELKESISRFKKGMPDEIISIYDLISKKYDVCVCPMINSTCTGCSIKLPIGIGKTVMSDSQCVSCPNCGRFLYYDDAQMQRPDDALHYKGIARFSSPNLMLPSIDVKSKEEAIVAMGHLSASAGFVEDGENFIQALLKRDALVSTCVGSGMAFPHARGIRACGLTLAVGICKNGINVGEEEPLQLFFVSAVPTQTSVFYIELVSKLARYFGKNENREKLIACENADDMWKIMVKIGR